MPGLIMERRCRKNFPIIISSIKKNKMQEIDWSKFTTRININADFKKIFSSWTTSSGLTSWFLRYAEFKTPANSIRPENESVQVGDTYTWRWYGYPDEVDEKGEVLEMNGRDFFAFSFG